MVMFLQFRPLTSDSSYSPPRATNGGAGGILDPICLLTIAKSRILILSQERGAMRNELPLLWEICVMLPILLVVDLAD